MRIVRLRTGNVQHPSLFFDSFHSLFLSLSLNSQSRGPSCSEDIVKTCARQMRICIKIRKKNDKRRLKRVPKIAHRLLNARTKMDDKKRVEKQINRGKYKRQSKL